MVTPRHYCEEFQTYGEVELPSYHLNSLQLTISYIYFITIKHISLVHPAVCFYFGMHSKVSSHINMLNPKTLYYAYHLEFKIGLFLSLFLTKVYICLMQICQDNTILPLFQKILCASPPFLLPHSGKHYSDFFHYKFYLPVLGFAYIESSSMYLV